MGLAAAQVAVLPDDPLAAAPVPGVHVVSDAAALLAQLRTSLLDEHVTPLLDELTSEVRLGRRALLGSLAAGVCHALVGTASLWSGTGMASTATTVSTVLGALGVSDLVELGPQLTVQRRTCCLAFRLPEPKICYGCCISGTRQERHSRRPGEDDLYPVAG
ncbi:MAG TPA: hypothetical protein VJT31_00710 [Rugosimonospora sp.]|nr:hypothetical protein [Rugosimonospora sp.]